MEKIDIGIIGAMDSEVTGLVGSLENVREEVHGAIKFYIGELYGKRAAVTKCGIGKVFAAMTAEAMILLYSPSLIINTGVGGALKSGLKTADVVIADKLAQHDMDTSALGDPKGLISSASKYILLMPEISPLGSPRADVSISCCASLSAITTSAVLSPDLSAPPTPVFIIRLGE